MTRYENQLPALRDPELTPQKAVAQLPQISGDAYSHVGKYAGAVVMACFEQVGGLQRMVAWADDNYGDFATKLLPKIIQRTAHVDHQHAVTIDDAISRLESQPIEGQYSNVSDSFFEDFTPNYDL